MKSICQLYLPAFYRSYGKRSLNIIESLLKDLKNAGFSGIYLIALWEDGGYDNGFDVAEYYVNPRFGSVKDFVNLIREAHGLGLEVGVDVIPNNVSDKHMLAQNCLNGVSGFEDALCWTTKEEAKRLSDAGVPSFFGKLAYSNFGDKYVRSTFTDYHQLNLNWKCKKVQEYFEELFGELRALGVDFARIDCGMMLLEDTSKAKKGDPFACTNPKASVEAVREVSGGMKMFFEWFDPSSADLIFGDMPECYALDCSYVVTRIPNMDWSQKKLIPLLGGHDQMTAADRGINIPEALEKMALSEYAFLDLQTLVGWKTEPRIFPRDEEFDVDLNNPNQRYRARREIKPVIQKFLAERRGE